MNKQQDIKVYFLDWEKLIFAGLNAELINFLLGQNKDLFPNDLYNNYELENYEVIVDDDYESLIPEIVFSFLNANDRPNGKIQRSLSVGDVISYKNKYFRVLQTGIEEFKIGCFNDTDTKLIHQKDDPLYRLYKPLRYVFLKNMSIQPYGSSFIINFNKDEHNSIAAIKSSSTSSEIDLIITEYVNKECRTERKCGYRVEFAIEEIKNYLKE